MRVKTRKVSNLGPRGSGKESKLFPKCKEKAFMSFMFGCFGCNKENCLEREGYG